VFSVLFFSPSVISDEKSYGPADVVMILLSYMIAFGVVVHVGAVAGRQWNERRAAAPANPPEQAEPVR